MNRCEMCDDNRFEIIKELKEYIIESSNIETSPDEMKVLDDICFRLWQLGLTLDTKRKLEKLKKAIKLLKEKPEVLEFGLENFEWDEYQQLYIYVYEYTDTIHEYNFSMEEYVELGSIETEEYSLTKQEYDLLKEVV